MPGGDECSSRETQSARPAGYSTYLNGTGSIVWKAHPSPTPRANALCNRANVSTTFPIQTSPTRAIQNALNGVRRCLCHETELHWLGAFGRQEELNLGGSSLDEAWQ